MQSDSCIHRVFANLTLTDAELRSGENSGNTVPLVPPTRFSTGVSWKPAKHWTVRADLLHVNDQVLANDEANAEPELPDYTVVNARLAWRWLFLDVTNVLDEKYATRGIYAFDFKSFENAIFVTPAPGRRFLAGAEWRF